MARHYDFESEWPPYVPVAERRRRAREMAAQLRKAGRILSPVEISGRKIARTFWGEAWCKNLESYSDFANRLPRGRTYVRNGSVLDLQIAEGSVRALVNGSDIYDVEIRIEKLVGSLWQDIKRGCAGKIGSLVELLQGRLAKGVMEVVTQPRQGLFPTPGEIALGCSCPDWATLCKHVAATLYGIGARLDDEPELLFVLRGVDPAEMVESVVEQPVVPKDASRGRTLADDDLSSIFGVEIEVEGNSGADLALPDSESRRPKTNTSAKRTKSSATKKARSKRTTSAGKKASTRRKKRSTIKGSAGTQRKTASKKAKAPASSKKKSAAKRASAGRKKVAAKGSKASGARKKNAPKPPRR